MKKIKTIEQMDFYKGINKDKKNESIIDMNKFLECIKEINTAKRNEVIVYTEKFNKWYKDTYGEYNDHYLTINCLTGAEKKRFDQGIIEIKRKQYKPIKKFLSFPNIESKKTINHEMTNESVQLPQDNYFLVNSLERALQKKGGQLKNDFSYFYEFLDDLFNKKKNFEFQEYLLTESEEKKNFQDKNLIPYRYLYKENMIIQCLLDNSNKFIYFTAFKGIHPFRSELFLKQIMNEHFNLDPLYADPLFFSLEIKPQDAAKILGYAIIEVTELLDNRKIYSNNPKRTEPLLPEDDQRLIPLIELYVYIQKSNIDNKQEKIDLLIKYMDTTSKAIVGQLDKSKLPHPLDGNKDYLCYKNEYNKLKRKKPTPEDRYHYISIIIPILTKIVKIVESDDFKNKKHNLINTTEFFEAIREIDKTYPFQGEIIGKTMFNSLSDNYRHGKKGRPKKTFDWLKELKKG